MTNQQTTAIVKRAQSLQPSALSESSLDGSGDFSHSTELQYLTSSALKQGVHVMAGPGAGKSRWLGRVPAWIALLRQEPLVVIDPTGLVIDNLLDKIVHLPLEVQQQLYPRLKYIDAGAQDYVVPTPLYDRQSPSDTLFEIANRLPSVFERQDPALAGAPILGLNALKECAIHAGKIATALGRQLDFVVDLIDHPGKYKVLLREVLAEHPDLQPAVTYFRELMDPTSARLREKRTGSFKNKLLHFLADPTMLATFAGTRKRLRWEKAIQKRKAVLIDLRNERDPDRRQFKMIWYLKTFMDYIKYRGTGGRGHEVMLIIDEITDMLNQRTKAGDSILAEDIEELITRIGRNLGVNVIVAHQNLSQLDERIQNVLMQMGTQMIGRLANPDDAVRVARQFLRYDPYWVKKTERVWMSIRFPAIYAYFGFPEEPVPMVIDKKYIEFTPEEQLLMLVNKLQSLGRFRFLTKTATGEGDLRSVLKRISIERLDQDHYPNEDILAPLRRQLAQRDGVPVETLLAEIRANYTREAAQKTNKQVKAPKEPARLDNTHDSADHLPVTPEPATPVSSPRKRPGTRKSHAEEVFQ